MSFHGLCSFRLISRNDNFHRAPSVFRSDQQTASLTSFLSEEVIKWTAVHRLTVPASTVAAASLRTLAFTGVPCFHASPHLYASVYTAAAGQTPPLQSSIKTPFFFLVCFNGLIITVLHDCKELFLISSKLGWVTGTDKPPVMRLPGEVGGGETWTPARSRFFL